MAFEIEQIDRSVEWAIRDAVIAKGYWPNERLFITTDDQDGYNAALNDLQTKIDVFGVGNYKDREQLKKNNIIIDRESISDGAMGFSSPVRFDLQPNLTFNKIYSGEGSSNIEYEIRFVADDVTLDRIINLIIIQSIGRRKLLYGIKSDLTPTEDYFYIERNGVPVDLSSDTYIERVFRFIVRDVILNEDKILQQNIPMIKEIKSINNIATEDVTYPESRNDVTENTIDVNSYFIQFIQDISAWKKMLSARLYCNKDQASALNDLIDKSKLVAINSGLTFTPYVGFSKTALGQFLNTRFSPLSYPDFGLTNFSYSVFVTDVPGSGIMELFGLKDLLNTVSFYLTSDAAGGFEAKGNSNSVFAIPTFKAKSNTLYVLNSRNRFQLELFEGSRLIAILQLPPTGIPVGSFSELNIFNNSGVAIGTSIAGGIAFSSQGKGLLGSEVKELNEFITFFMTQVGIIK